MVLATPPELLVHASLQERARVESMLDNILPVSLRAEGLRSDTAVGKHLSPSPLESIRAQPSSSCSCHRPDNEAQPPHFQRRSARPLHYPANVTRLTVAFSLAS